MINQYSSTTSQATIKAPDPNNVVEFPFLHNGHQRQQDYLHKSENDKVIQDLSNKNKTPQQVADTETPKKQHSDATASPNETSTKPPKSTNDISTKLQSKTNTTSAKPYSHYDIICINESNLEIDRPFSLKGYNIYRNDRIDKSGGGGGGGVLLAMKEHIKCYEIFNKMIEKNEILAVQIEAKTIKLILIASIYVPPTAKINRNVFHELYSINSNCLIVDDLNAALFQMGSKKTNAKGRQLQEFLNEGFLNCIEDDSPTYERNNYEEKIDWILVSQTLKLIHHLVH
ncbi:unnamed protein product [Rotaria sordida]|uniref:Endonuclease/exonuclease/phosphatase domain-containing protein n=1 Tax=Rotaria sordida TaxID=392033 RepID=A0A820BDS9_9BILA|nr:unnamed protein product [Rotaria sordida]